MIVNLAIEASSASEAETIRKRIERRYRNLCYVVDARQATESNWLLIVQTKNTVNDPIFMEIAKDVEQMY